MAANHWLSIGAKNYAFKPTNFRLTLEPRRQPSVSFVPKNFFIGLAVFTLFAVFRP